VRLHAYDRQIRQENQKLGTVFETAAQAVTGYEDLQQRAFALEAAFQIDPALNEDLRDVTVILEKDLRQVLQWRSGELKNSGEGQVASDKISDE
jgi:hypothetical protein